MTTIAYDGVALVSDSQVTIGNTPVLKERKIHALRRTGKMSFLAGVAGSQVRGFDLIRDFVAYWTNIRQETAYSRSPGITGEHQATVIVVVLRPSEDDRKMEHRAFLLTSDGNVTEITGARWAIGSGGDFALGAMDAGADALKAVRIAIERDVNSGGLPVSHKIRDYAALTPDQFTDLPL